MSLLLLLGGGSGTQAGVRSMLAFWMGGASAPEAAPSVVVSDVFVSAIFRSRMMRRPV